MDPWLDGNEDLFLLAPIFSLAQKCGGGGAVGNRNHCLLAWFSCFIN